MTLICMYDQHVMISVMLNFNWICIILQRPDL